MHLAARVLTKIAGWAKKDFSKGSKIASLHDMTRPSILEQILAQTRNQARNQARNQTTDQSTNQTVAFDLDSTLFEVTGRHQTILREFVESEHLQGLDEVKSILSKVVLGPKDHGLEHAVRRAQAFSKEHEPLALKLIEFWRHRFFSNEYLEIDVPYEGAVEFVNELHSAGARIIYLTGRDIPRMGVGTLKQLSRWKFPTPDQGAQLIMKPTKTLEDASFKTSELKSLGGVNWFFENEPQILHRVQSELPELNIVFFESSHSGKVQPNRDWQSINCYRHGMKKS